MSDEFTKGDRDGLAAARISNDDHVVALHAACAERPGKQLDVNAMQVFHVRDGKVTEAWAVQHDLYGYDEFWS